jgi:hypothetical protein
MVDKQSVTRVPGYPSCDGPGYHVTANRKAAGL